MPRIRPADSYSSEFQAMLEDVSSGNVGSVAIECPDVKAALSTRATWYAYVSALKRAAVRAEGLLLRGVGDQAGLQEDINRYAMAQRCHSRLEGTTFFVESRSNGPMAQRIRAALEKARQQPGPAPIVPLAEEQEISEGIARLAKLATKEGKE